MGAENNVRDPSKRQMLSKANRFVAWLATDRQTRGLPAGGDDMGRVTSEDIIRYKEGMLDPKTGFSHRTIKHHLDDLKTLFRYGAKNRPASITDPTVGMTFKYHDNGRSKPRPYTPDERAEILGAARNEKPVIRWCQWVAWATGARVSEIAEASTLDVTEIGGMWCIKILLDNRDEDASLKNEESHRIVALHSALIREGFLDYVQAIRRKYGDTAPLFPDLKTDRDGRRGNPASRTISKWMRDKIKIKDLRIAPNHSWRHTFESIHRNELDPPTREDIVAHIVGHSMANGPMGRRYGIFEIKRDRVDIERMVCPV